MIGPKCPIHGTPTWWLSTTNQWEYYCEACDKRYNRKLKPMPDSEYACETAATGGADG